MIMPWILQDGGLLSFEVIWRAGQNCGQRSGCCWLWGGQRRNLPGRRLGSDGWDMWTCGKRYCTKCISTNNH